MDCVVAPSFSALAHTVSVPAIDTGVVTSVKARNAPVIDEHSLKESAPLPVQIAVKAQGSNRNRTQLYVHLAAALSTHTRNTYTRWTCQSHRELTVKH
jgi:hypothetical protein